MTNNKGFAPLITAVALLVLAVVSGVVLVSQNQNPNEEAKQNRPTPSASPSSNPLVSPTATSSASPKVTGEKIKICHVPPGKAQNAQSIEISKNAWDTGHDPHNAHSLDFVITATKKCPPASPTPTPTPKPSLSPTPTPTIFPL